MLNIISRSILFKNVSGPKKVVENLIKGLDKLGYPYVINKRLDACKRLWIHDDTVALKKIASLPSEIKVIGGPNLYNFATDIPQNIDFSRVIYLHPSDWVKNFWLELGFNKCLIDVWPTGIDTEEFKPSNKRKEFILVYFKQRFNNNNKLEIVKGILKSKNITYRIIDSIKGYKESDYKALLSKSRYIIWLGCQESQGIALQEAMASGVPILVWDVKYMVYWQVSENDAAIFNEEEKIYHNTTSAPYFDDSCGIKIKDASELEKAIDFMEKNLDKFQPRKYILENLSLEKQAKEFILLYQKHFGLSYEEGFKEKLLKNGDWLNNKLYYNSWLKLKSFIKLILIKIDVWKYIRK